MIAVTMYHVTPVPLNLLKEQKSYYQSSRYACSPHKYDNRGRQSAPLQSAASIGSIPISPIPAYNSVLIIFTIFGSIMSAIP